METPENSLAPSHLWRHSKKTAAYEPEAGSLLDNNSAGSLILDFSGSRTLRNKFLLFKLQTLWYSYYCSPNGLRHQVPTCLGKPTVDKKSDSVVIVTKRPKSDLQPVCCTGALTLPRSQSQWWNSSPWTDLWSDDWTHSLPSESLSLSRYAMVLLCKSICFNI